MYDAYCIIHTWDTRMILKLCLQNTQEKANFIAAKKARKILLHIFVFFLKIIFKYKLTRVK